MKVLFIFFGCFAGVLSQAGNVKTTTEEYAVGVIRYYEIIPDSTTAESDDEADGRTTVATSSATRLNSGSSQAPRTKPKSEMTPNKVGESKVDCSYPGKIFDKNLECPAPKVDKPSLTVSAPIVMMNKAFGDDLPSDDDLDPKTATGLMYYRSYSYNMRLPFEFSYYGHQVKNLVISTNGYIFTGPASQKYHAQDQSIFPLMADWDVSLHEESAVVLYEDPKDPSCKTTKSYSRITFTSYNIKSNSILQLITLPS